MRRGLFDALTPEQVAALRDISDTLVANLSDEPVWPAAEDQRSTPRLAARPQADAA